MRTKNGAGGARPVDRMLARLGELLGGGGFAVFAVALVIFYEGLLVALLLTPPAETGLGAFAAEFRVWCFGAGAGDGGLDPRWLAAMLGPPAMLAGIVALLWWDSLAGILAAPARAVTPVAAALCLVLAATGAFATLVPAGTDASALAFPADALRTAHPAPQLRLRDQTGAVVDLAELRGKVVLLTGVYASCPHTCPLILDQARGAIEALPESQREDVQVVAVTLDPERDSMEALAELADRHGLAASTYRLVTGAPDRVEQILDRMELARRRDPETGVIDHANLFLVIDRAGQVAYRFALGEQQERWLVEALRILVSEPDGRT